MSPPPVNEDRAHRQDEESTAVLAPAPLLGVNAWHKGKEPLPPGMATRADATTPHQAAATARHVARGAEDQLSPSPGSP